MSERDTKVRRFVARIRAVFEEDWNGRAGDAFRQGTAKISDFNTQHLQLEEKAAEVPDLAWKAVQGVAGEKHAKATSDYAKAENDRIDLALKERVLADKVRQERATADKLEAEASIAKMKELRARAELFQELKALDVAFTVNETGVIELRPSKVLSKSYGVNGIFTASELKLLNTASIDVLMPDFAEFGEDVVETTLTRWLCRPGQIVAKDQPLFEISTVIVDAEIPSPVSGRVHEVLVPEGALALPGTVVCRITSGEFDDEAPNYTY